ncbi:MAG TPA: CvpA family protein [Verrucomicrobiae bacterium]
MIAAATQHLASGKALFNWFDVALVVMIGFGIWRGRRNGMTKEIFPVSLWLTIVIAGAFGYKPLGDLFIQSGIVKSLFGKTVGEETLTYISSYLIIAGAVFIIHSFIRRRLKPKLEGSNAFGSSEYYFGMVSGAVRYFCIVIFALAMLNAPVYTQADIQAAKAYNNRWFGGGMAGYGGDFFPTLSEAQISIFKDSQTGPFIKDDLSLLLVNTGSYVAPSSKNATIYIGK